VKGGAPTLNLRKLAGALAAPGQDTRFWLSYGIVASVSDKGTPDTSNPGAVIAGPEGVEMDVVLLPSEDPIVCRFPSGGRTSTDDWPIRPGDEVLVGIPEGLPGAGGVILGVMNSADAQLPVEDDGKPMFRHDRRQIWALVPIDLRTPGGGVTINPDGSILLGRDGATHPLILGDDHMSNLLKLLKEGYLPGGTGSLWEGLNKMQAVCTTAPLVALKPGLLEMMGAIEAFAQAAAAAGNWLSGTTKTK
jgi:hypothetical protein